MNIGYRDFRGGDQVVVGILEFEKVLLEFGELAGTGQAGRIDDEGWEYLEIAVKAGVKIEHETDESAFHGGPNSPVEGKARPGHPRRPLKIDDPQTFRHIPVGFGLEVEFRRLTPYLDHWIVMLILSHCHRWVGHVRDEQENFVKLFLDRCKLLIQVLDPLGHLAHFFNLGGCVLPRLLHLGDAVRSEVAPAFELFHLPEELTPFFIQAQEGFQIQVHLPVVQHPTHRFDMVTDELQVQHFRYTFVWKSPATIAYLNFSRT